MELAVVLEKMVHVGGQDKVVLALRQLKQGFMQRTFWLIIAVAVDLTAPVGPFLFGGREGIESC